MALGWLAILKGVPWSEVISTAPVVAEGAKKLWKSVAKKPAPVEPPATAAAPTVAPGAQAISVLESRVAAMEIAVGDLHAQMLASSELIKTLADQNGQLIARLESHRRRIIWLAVAVALAAVVTTACLALLLAQRGA